MNTSKKIDFLDQTVFYYKRSFFDENTISLPYFEKPIVSILIPIYNNIEYTINCLYSLSINIVNIPYEIIIINDNSTDDSQEYLSKIKNLKMINNTVNQGFLKNINLGIQKSDSEFILIFNNDILVFPNFLEKLFDVFNTQKNIGAVGPMLLFEDLTLQEAGAYLDSNAEVTNIGRQKNPIEPNYNFYNEVDYCSGCCLLTRRILPDGTIAFLDELYLPAYYEETDLCMRLKNHYNLKIIYQPLSKVIHFESISYSEKKQAALTINKEKFRSKWEKELKKIEKERNDYFNKTYLFLEVHNENQSVIEKLTELNDNSKLIYCSNKSFNNMTPKHKTIQSKGIEVIYSFKKANSKRVGLKRKLKPSLKYSNEIILLYENLSFQYFYYYLVLNLLFLKKKIKLKKIL